jgi:hypothetical protein
VGPVDCGREFEDISARDPMLKNRRALNRFVGGVKNADGPEQCTGVTGNDPLSWFRPSTVQISKGHSALPFNRGRRAVHFTFARLTPKIALNALACQGG